MKRGEVWWFEHPDRKPRPVCVLTRDEAIGHLHQVIVVEATSTVRGLPTEVLLDEGDGLPRPCALSFDTVSAVDKSYLTRRLTQLPERRMFEACRALAFATGC